MDKEDLKKIDEIVNNDLIKEWLIFREEEISTMNAEDKKYLIHFDEHFENILKTVPKNSHTQAKKELDNIYDDFIDYSTHWNEKYYMTGFGDALRLVIGVFSNK